MTVSPHVTVLMTVRNGEPYLHEAVASILAQSYADFRFLILDNASTDNSRATIQNFHDPRIELIALPQDLGQTGALNHGLSLIKSPFIARMDADDISLPQRLAQQVAFLETHPEVGLLGSAYYEIDTTGQVSRLISFPTDDHTLRHTLAQYCPFAHSAMMLRRAVLEKTGPYNHTERYRHFQDLELWIRFAQHAQIANLAEPLIKLRIHATSSAAKHDDARLRNDIELRARAIRLFNLPLWYWWYVFRARVGLWLPMPARTLLRRIMYQGRAYR